MRKRNGRKSKKELTWDMLREHGLEMADAKRSV